MSVHIRQPGSCKPCADPEAPVGSKSSRLRSNPPSRSLLFLGPGPKCPCWQQHNSYRNNNAACTYQVIKQAKDGFPLLIPLVMLSWHALSSLAHMSFLAITHISWYPFSNHSLEFRNILSVLYSVYLYFCFSFKLEN